MPEIIWTPYKATMKINKILDTVYPSLNERFPINIESLAKDIHALFNWNDPRRIQT